MNFSHDNTPPGFQPCTREAGHDGPCALPFDDIDFEDGPCFDYCPCRRCWNGWTGLPWWKRLLYRLEHVVRSRSLS